MHVILRLFNNEGVNTFSVEYQRTTMTAAMLRMHMLREMRRPDEVRMTVDIEFDGERDETHSNIR